MKHSGFFVVREPLIPYGSITCKALVSVLNSGTFLDTVQQYSEEKPKEPLNKFLTALFLSSPSFFYRLQRNCSKANGDLEKIPLKTRSALQRYILRATSRCTPFGLFSGVSVGEVGVVEQNRTTIGNAIEISAFPSASASKKVVDEVKARLRNCNTWPVCLNPSIDTRPHFVSWYALEQNADKSSFKKYSLPFDHIVDDLRQFVEAGNKGVRSIGDVLSYLSYDPNPELARRILDELLDRNFLRLADLPDRTCLNVVDHLVKRCEFYRVDDRLLLDWLARLSCAYNNASYANAMSLGNLKSLTSNMGEVLNSFEPVEKNKNSNEPPNHKAKMIDENAVDDEIISNIIHFDTHVNCSRQVLSSSEADSIMGKLEFIVQATAKPDQRYKKLKQIFYQKFDINCVPFLVALDPQVGIDAAEIFDFRDQSPADELTELERYIASNFRSAVTFNDGGFEYAEIDIKSYTPTMEQRKIVNKLRGGSALLARHTSDREQDFYELKYIHEGTGLEMMARFGLGSSQIHASMEKQYLKFQEASPNIVLAELIHEDRAESRDITTTPLVCDRVVSTQDYYKPNLIETAVEEINVKDLFIEFNGDELSVRNRSGQRVLPILSSAIAWNYSGYSNIFRLIPLLCRQVAVGFQWPQNFIHMHHLPRLKYKDVVFCPASWLIPLDFINKIRDSSMELKINALRLLVSSLNLPRFFYVGLGDEKIRIDVTEFDDLAACCAILFRIPPPVRVYECLDFDRNRVTSTHVRPNEILFPFTRPTDVDYSLLPRRKPPHLAPFESIQDQQKINPGDGWSYFKIYGDRYLIEIIVKNIISDLNNDLMNPSSNICWFFIRYSEGGDHIRLRLKDSYIEAGSASSNVARKLAEALGDEQIARWSIDTYERECYRYGGNFSINIVEQIFCIDSYYAIFAIDLKWSLSNAHVDHVLKCALVIRMLFLLKAFYDDYKEVLEVTQYWSSYTDVAPNLAAEARSIVKDLDVMLDEYGSFAFISKEYPNEVVRLSQVAAECMVQECQYSRQIRSLEAQGRLTIALESIIRSIFHMSCNRILVNWSSDEEIVVIESAKRMLIRASLRK